MGRGFINSKKQLNNEVTENFIHREMHIAFATSLIFVKHLFCHRLTDEFGEPLTAAVSVTNGFIEAGIAVVSFFVIYQILTFLYIKKEDPEARAVMAYYFVVVVLVLREIVSGIIAFLNGL